MKIFKAKDLKVKLAKSILLGCLISFIIGFYTMEEYYYKSSNDHTLSVDHYISQRGYIKKRDYNELFIIIGFLAGTAIGYTIIQEEK